MSLPPSIINNEDGGIDNPFDDGENTPMWAMVPKSEREAGNPALTIQFNSSTLGTPSNGTDTRVISTQDQKHVIKWATMNNVVAVEKAVWQGFNTTTQTYQTISDSSISADGIDGLTYTPNSKEVSLPVFLISDQFTRWIGLDQYLTLHWKAGGQPGSTRSGIFTVCNSAMTSPECSGLVSKYDSQLTDTKKDIGEDNPSDSASQNEDSPSPSGSSTPTASSPGSGISPLVPSSSSSSSSSGGGGGLPAGAIAGIVVGAVLGIAVIAFLAWFCLRRRRRASNVSSGSGHGPPDYLADKETQARVTESPHSPYTDDGQHLPQQQFHHAQNDQFRHDDQDAVLPASASSPTGRRSFAPYEEHTPIASRSVDNVNRDGARSSTPNVNSNVSHLIEDGMTEDEIRRLEEEERALDAAIEQAGQGGGQGQRR